MKKGKIRNAAVCLCLGIMILFMLSIIVRILTKNILINRLGMDNRFTRTVFYGDKEIIDFEDMEGEEDSERTVIAWQEYFPFTQIQDEEAMVEVFHENAEENQDTGQSFRILLHQLKTKVDIVEHGIERYTSNHLLGYSSFVEAYNGYKKAVHWNIARTTEYNGVVEFPDGHLMVYSAEKDVSSSIESVTDFYKKCEKEQIDFLYIQAPYKICKYQDADVSGTLDFSNQNADMLLNGLEKSGVPCMDLREEMHKENVVHHDLFYKTDHHWKAETGLWATSVLADQLNQNFGFSIDTALYEENAFDKMVYEDWFLGSGGRKVTLARAKPDDISLLYPKYETVLDYKIPEKNIDETGDFSITYDMSQLDTRDYYGLDPYGAYNHSGAALVQIHNQKNQDGRKLLFIGDSYLNSMVPFMALGVENVDMLDLRDFDGSVESYIEQTEPDMVIILYNPTSIESVDESSHTGTFDFR